MSEATPPVSRLTPEPMPENIASVQPGGGFCYSVELAWGRLRRWYLRTFRKGYVRRMAESRQGDPAGCPHEVLDPRDLKYCRNQCTCRWNEADDPFTWRNRLYFTRWGLAELQIMGYPLLAATVALALTWWYLAPIPGTMLGLVLYFFRDPARRIPAEAGLLVSPADGTIAEVIHLEHEEFVGGPAVRIGIFLSIFNVHVNRSPAAARVIRLRYSPGEFLNALNPESAVRNENMWIGLEEEAWPHRKLVVRQVAGLIARRIVCDLRTGDRLERGQRFGMIKLGSRTELILPDEEGLQVEVRVGQKVHGGSTVFARYKGSDETKSLESGGGQTL